MSVLKDFALPDLGEGLTESEIVSWSVSVGDRVELNQILGEVETAKALVELPSPFAGVVNRLYAEPGTTVQVGAPIVAFEVDDGAGGDAPAEGAATASAGGTGVAGRQSVLVGYGPPIETGVRPKRRARSGAVRAQETPHAAEEDTAATRPQSADAPARAGAAAVDPTVVPAERPRSTPPVRKLARDLGVDLMLVAGTGEGGLITRHDVESFVTEGGPARGAGGGNGGARKPEAGARPVVAAGDRPREMRLPIKGVRKRTAEAMVASAFTAPQATEFLTVDVTRTLELIASLKERPEFAGARVGILTVVAKALCIAAARTPEINSRWDGEAEEILQYGYVNLGIAVATPRGLMVPNLKDADRLPLAALASGIADLAETARAGRTAPADLGGGTITITNVGVFGVDSGTPIVNPGEAAILAVGAVRRRPWEHRGELALREAMTLSVSFDHRLVDGEQGSRFLREIGAILQEPGVVLSMV